MSDEWISSVWEKLENTSTATGGEFPTIFRVPPNIRLEDEKAYEPRIISIGPYHHGKDAFKNTEELKWRYLRGLVTDRGVLEDSLRLLKDVEGRARLQYLEPIRMTSDEFTGMLLLDGFFIVSLSSSLANQVSDKGKQTFWETPTNLYTIWQDLLLLENQIPFFIVENIYNLVKNLNSDMPGLDKGLLSLFEFNCNMDLRFPGESTSTPYHLLHLFHICIKWQKRNPRDRQIDRVTQEKIPTATKLNDAGITFRSNMELGPFQSIFIDGVIEMSKLTIEDNTIPILQNLVAFEQCLPQIGQEATIYVSFLDDLVDNQLDVSLLTREGVMESLLGSEAEAADLLNKLCKNVGTDDAGEHHLDMLYEDVNEYYLMKRWPRWRAKLHRDYFGSPWTIISLLAAAILLLLTVAQTVFTAMSYWDPRN